jgi:hypothetical protein
LLAGLGLPAINGAMQAGKKAEVSAMAESIKTAVNANQRGFVAVSSGSVWSAVEVRAGPGLLSQTNYTLFLSDASNVIGASWPQ